MMVSTIASTLMPFAWIITERTMSRRMAVSTLRPFAWIITERTFGFSTEKTPSSAPFCRTVSIAASWMRRCFAPALAVFALAAPTVLVRHQAKEEAVLVEEGDDSVDHSAEFIFGILLAIGLALELLVEPPNAFKNHRKVQLFLVGKIRVDRPLADTGLVGNIVHQRTSSKRLAEKRRAASSRMSFLRSVLAMDRS